MNILSLFVFLSITLSNQIILPVIKGSNTDVSVEDAASFPAADNDNIMLGFGWFKNGFTLEDQTTTCTFDSVYPVSGAVDLNGGTLCLTSDLLFNNVTSLQGMGTVFGGNHLIELCSSITYIPSDAQVFQDVTLLLNDDIVLTSAITIMGNCVICGNGNTLSLGDNGGFIVANNSTLELRDVEVNNIAGSNIRCVDDTGIIILDDMQWIQDNHFTFSFGSFIFEDNVEFVGSFTFSYESAQTSTLLLQSRWRVADGLCLSIGRKSSLDDVEPVIFSDATSILELDNCTLLITDYGIEVTKGRLEIKRFVNVDINGTTTTYGAFVGNGLEDDDFLICMHAGAVLTHRAGCLTFRNYAVDKITAASRNAKLVRQEGSNIFIHTDLTLPEMTIELASNSVPMIQILSGKKLLYAGTTVITQDVEFDLKGRQFTGTTYVLNGDGYVFFTRGSLPLNIAVVGTDNKLHGSGNQKGWIVLQNSSAELTYGVNGMMLSPINLNNGKIILESDLIFNNGYRFSNDGTISLSSHRVIFGPQNFATDKSLYWDGQNGSVDLHSNILLSGTWTFSGECNITGNGNILYLLAEGELVVECGSQLTLKNLIIKGINSDKIRCSDDASVLVLDNVTWLQNGDYAFSTGALRFENENEILGNSVTFAFQTSRTSTILSESSLFLDAGVTFSYDPIIIAQRDLLEFQSLTSELILNGCTLHTTVTGLQLKEGKMHVKRTSNLSSEKQVTETNSVIDQGIMFGNGAAEQDFRCFIYPGVFLNVVQGSLHYNNVGSTSLKMASSSSSICMQSGTKLCLWEDLYLNNGSVTFNHNTILARKEGKKIIGSINVYGDMSIQVFEEGDLE